jgi:spermidine/putrescine transport system ATP-binding protein
MVARPGYGLPAHVDGSWGGAVTPDDGSAVGVATQSERGRVELVGVTKRFGAMTAVDNLHLDVRPGEFLSLLGPSGCGKTTTLRMLAGFEQPDDGAIRISGVAVDGTPPYQRDVNTVFQHYALFPHMTVAENVAYGLRQKKVKKSDIGTRVGEALGMVKMAHLAGRSPRQLSGGQQQRVALARALVNRPSLLLLDEPLGALDRKLRQEMQIELKLLQSELGITFVFVTHDQEEALAMSDRIAVMVDGRIDQLDDPDHVYENPATAFVAGFIGQNNFWPGTMIHDGLVSPDGTHLMSSRSADLPSGTKAVAAVRPESITLVERDATATVHGPNHMIGQVLSVSHLGDVLQYAIARTDNDPLLARLPRHQAPKLVPGDSVLCSWDAESVAVYPAD